MTTVTHVDPAIVTARHGENVVVGDEIIRHRRASRLIHWSVAVTFFLALITGMPIWTPLFRWMHFRSDERGWWNPKKLMAYMRWNDEPAQEGGKYNPGQKLFFWAVCLGALGFLVSGIVMWFPLYFPEIVREIAILLHDITFIFFLVGIIMHIYLGTAAEPGTFRSMTRGTVTRRWARLHHPGWLRDVDKK
jgi:formate dehydrogenase subunit gamma